MFKNGVAVFLHSDLMASVCRTPHIPTKPSRHVVGSLHTAAAASKQLPKAFYHLRTLPFTQVDVRGIEDDRVMRYITRYFYSGEYEMIQHLLSNDFNPYSSSQCAMVFPSPKDFHHVTLAQHCAWAVAWSQSFTLPQLWSIISLLVEMRTLMVWLGVADAGLRRVLWNLWDTVVRAINAGHVMMAAEMAGIQVGAGAGMVDGLQMLKKFAESGAEEDVKERFGVDSGRAST